MKYYLEQVSIGFNLDRYLFDSQEEALEYLLEHLDLGNFAETHRILKAIGKKSYGARWDITPVFNWENREFGEPRSYIEIRHATYAELTEYGAGPEAFSVEFATLPVGI